MADEVDFGWVLKVSISLQIIKWETIGSLLPHFVGTD